MQRTIEETVKETIQALGWLVEHGYLLRDASEVFAKHFSAESEKARRGQTPDEAHGLVASLMRVPEHTVSD